MTSSLGLALGLLLGSVPLPLPGAISIKLADGGLMAGVLTGRGHKMLQLLP